MYKYYATKSTNVSEGNFHVFRTNIDNMIDGGEVLNINVLPFNHSATLDYTSGSLSSTTSVARRIHQFANWMTASADNPYIESDETTFNSAYSQSLVFLNNMP